MSLFDYDEILTVFYSLLKTVALVFENYWRGNSNNRVYLALFMIYDRITRLEPACFFDLPRIGHKLKEANSNMSDYPKWGKGKDHFGDIFF